MKEFFINLAKGTLLGVVILVPGVSAGTLTVLLNIYEKMITALSGLRKDFKNSFKFLLPIILGIIIGLVGTYFPLQWGLHHAPLPTVLLFLGLMIGSFPKLFKDSVKMGFKKTSIINLLVPAAAVIGICFIPNINNMNLGANMPIHLYFILILLGAVCASALFVPGISGSMVLVIFGLYEPILDTIAGLKVNFGHSIAVLAMFAIGAVIGFFSIVKLMKFFLNKFPRGTYMAITGFVMGSMPAILISFNYASAPINTVQISVGAVLCVVCAVISFLLTYWADKVMKKSAVVAGGEPSSSQDGNFSSEVDNAEFETESNAALTENTDIQTENAVSAVQDTAVQVEDKEELKS